MDAADATPEIKTLYRIDDEMRADGMLHGMPIGIGHFDIRNDRTRDPEILAMLISNRRARRFLKQRTAAESYTKEELLAAILDKVDCFVKTVRRAIS